MCVCAEINCYKYMYAHMYVIMYACVCLCVCIVSHKGNRRLKFYPFRLNRLAARDIHAYICMCVCACVCVLV